VSTPTVSITTLGCRLNQVDSATLAARLEARGFHVADDPAGPADVVVVNTCTVTGRADASDRQAIRRAARRHPGAPVVVTGCLAQTDPRRVAALPDVALVVGNADKARLPDLVEQLVGAAAPGHDRRVLVSDVTAVRTVDRPVTPATRRARAFVKVQDGCQHRCAFCIVPAARGGSRSLEPGVVLDHAHRLVGLGYREIVLTGVDLGHYGADLRPRTDLASLIRALIDVRGLRWVRLSSVLPAYVTPALFEILTGSSRVAPHFHIPLQSGSDRVLRAMRRPYTARMYRSLVERLQAAIPGLGLGTDVIVGFPGETDADFDDTIGLVRALPFSYLHVFPYSERAATEAAALPGRVPSITMAARSRDLRAVGDEKRAAFARAMVGEEHEALVLECRGPDGGLVALTGNFVEVSVDGADALMRTVVRVAVTEAHARGARGTVVAR
jgi:threonylcarbamoyladenosine tRNA methylthiotransferase MtaB